MDKNELFQIGKVAELFHLSVGTLRHYEKEGLLLPEYVDEKTGYRYYSTRQFECLNTIRYLRALDMPLEKIGDFLRNRDVKKIQDMLLEQKTEVVRRQEELGIIERKIDNRLNQLQDALASEFDTIRVIQSGSRRISLIRDRLSLESYLDLEESIRRLEERQKETSVFLGKVGAGISREHLQAHQYDRYDVVFLLLEEEDVYEGKTEILPEETCVSIRFCGSHREAPEYYGKLMRWIAEKGASVAGFSREITMIDYGFTNNTDEFVTEIQIPVKLEQENTVKISKNSVFAAQES